MPLSLKFSLPANFKLSQHARNHNKPLCRKCFFLACLEEEKLFTPVQQTYNAYLCFLYLCVYLCVYFFVTKFNVVIYLSFKKGLLVLYSRKQKK